MTRLPLRYRFHQGAGLASPRPAWPRPAPRPRVTDNVAATSGPADRPRRAASASSPTLGTARAVKCPDESPSGVKGDTRSARVQPTAPSRFGTHGRCPIFASRQIDATRHARWPVKHSVTHDSPDQIHATPLRSSVGEDQKSPYTCRGRVGWGSFYFVSASAASSVSKIVPTSSLPTSLNHVPPG